MADREKVIKGLECCTNSDMSMCLDKCPYHTDGCSGGIKMMRDALSLLKEQEAIKPYIDYDGQDVWRCGKCGNSLMHPSYYESDEDAKNYIRYCSHCGQAVKWDGQNRTALDALLEALHAQYQQMNNLCIEIMHSNLDLMKQIIELRMELAEGRKNADVPKGQAGEGEAAGTA